MRYCCIGFTKSAEKPRCSGRGWIGVGRAGLNAQEPNKTHAVPKPSMGEGTAEVEAPAFMPGRTSTRWQNRRWRCFRPVEPHHEIDRAVGSRQPIRFLVSARRVLL